MKVSGHNLPIIFVVVSSENSGKLTVFLSFADNKLDSFFDCLIADVRV